jgi:hypothetical protein
MGGRSFPALDPRPHTPMSHLHVPLVAALLVLPLQMEDARQDGSVPLTAQEQAIVAAVDRANPDALARSRCLGIGGGA